MVEGAALEMLYRGNSIEGSNPSLSVFRRSHGTGFLLAQSQISNFNERSPGRDVSNPFTQRLISRIDLKRNPVLLFEMVN